MKTFFSTASRNIDDWLSPILVKELRQGMRARVFVLSFLLLQMFLAVLVMANVAAQDDRPTLESQNSFFWTIVGFALLAMMPLRGLVTVSQEVKNRTMETILLTRMTAWRVVFGKWTALFAQSLLFVSAVLPYVVLRYFLGGNDVVADALLMLVLLWLSGILIASSIAISALTNVVVRVIILVGLIGVTTFGWADMTMSGFTGMETWQSVIWFVIYGIFIPALLFEMTASGLAPVSENHAVRRRLLAVAFFLCSIAYYMWIGTNSPLLLATPLVALIGVCFYETAEKPQLVPSLVRPMARSAALGRIGALFFMPGWPSGLFFSLIAIPFATLTAYRQIAVTPGDDWLLVVLAALGSMLVPVLICHTLIPRLNQVLLIVVIYNLVLSLIAGCLEGFAGLTHSDVNPFLAFVPGLPVIYSAAIYDDTQFKGDKDIFIVGNSIVVAALVFVLLLASKSYLKQLFLLFNEARAARNQASLPAVPEQTQP